jgi:hypothetical protein
MHPDRLVDAAVAQTGLDDFGADAFREGLGVLCAAVTTEAKVNELGTAAIEAQITGNLSNRLRVVDWAKQHPEVREQTVAAPIFILGMPRTGTTLLSYLLHQDNRRRSLLRWEALNAIPPPEAEALTTDPRVDEARASQEMMDVLNPRFRAIHYEAPDGPTECVTLLAQDFKSLLWETLANIPSYGEWLFACDQTSAYDYHRLELQVLQSRAPGAWTLKSPHHCLALDVLFATYPDARVVMTHRDPVKVAGSLCSLITSLSGTFTDADHRNYITERWVGVLEEAVNRVMRFRSARPDAPFVDLGYRDLVSDPMGAIKGVYHALGETLPPEVEDGMRRYVTENPQDKHGRHVYSLEDFGIDAGKLREQFGDYRTAYDIPVEA